MRKLIITVILLINCLNIFSQRKFFPFGSFQVKNSITNGVSVGLFQFGDSLNVKSNGLRIELIGPGILLPIIPASPVIEDEDQFNSFVKDKRTEIINGINISGGGTTVDAKINGINLALIGTLITESNGVSATLLINCSQRHNGIQLGAFTCSHKTNGVQFGLIFNETINSNGIQIGGVNQSKKFTGLQISLFNKTEKLKGIQLGLWNVNEKRKLPFFNWNFK